MSRSHTTEKGTVLPILNLRGKDYLEVKYRLVWFREEHPGWTIETEFIALSERSATAKATVRDETGRAIATSHKTETASGFPDFMEKAETGAVGRALALIGYGTQFCGEELDEGSRIVDAPAEPVGRPGLRSGPARSKAQEPPDSAVDLSAPDLGEYEITFGRKYFGKKLKEISKEEIEGYLGWLKKQAVQKGAAPSFEVRALEKAVQWYHYPETRPDGGEAAEKPKASAKPKKTGPASSKAESTQTA